MARISILVTPTASSRELARRALFRALLLLLLLRSFLEQFERREQKMRTEFFAREASDNRFY